ncbi:34630_t:CDS:2 [Gigaspora margarita]|uniref:34630_t:CDS:1 n=1 Tax=Gigaspora margarita TaxID=4874 RepID=A0ABN7URB8_GIGMA|nr:34630_t:CDS:2 [Gigaspora margarita]
MEEQSQINQEFEFLLRENKTLIHDLSSHLTSLNANIYETDAKINETWNSCKKIRETYETQIENSQKDLLKWLQKIYKTIHQGNENIIQKENDDTFSQENQKSLKCLEEKMCELQNLIERKLSKSNLESLFNYEFSQIKELSQDSADETTRDDTSELDLKYEDVPLQLRQDNQDLREQLFKKIKLNKIKIHELEESVKRINRLADECEGNSLHVTTENVA